jgi:hypothetical protein
VKIFFEKNIDFSDERRKKLAWTQQLLFVKQYSRVVPASGQKWK